MARPWDVSFARQANMQQGPPPPPITPGPPPPLTIYPQAGPTQQAVHRAIRERGLGPEAWALAQQTKFNAVPLENMGIEGAGGGYMPDTGEIVIGVVDGKIGEPWARRTMAHELRHAYQDRGNAPNVPHWTNKNLNNDTYSANAQQWANNPQQFGNERVQAGLDFLKQSGLYDSLYGGQVPPWEIDSEIAADDIQQGQPPMTYDRLPPNMQPAFQGWYAGGGQPDGWEARQRGWGPAAVQMEDGSWGPPSTQFEDGSWGPAPLRRGPPRPWQ